MWWMSIDGLSYAAGLHGGDLLCPLFGTPCNTYSAARKDDGGPPPLRSLDWPDGLPHLAGDLLIAVFLGNLFRDRTIEACLILSLLGFDFSIENPLGSLIWATPSFKSFMVATRAFSVDFDQCAFGAPSMKPTRVVGSHQSLVAALFRKCPGRSRSHRHVVLKGKVFSQQFGRVVYRTKLAQVYPHAMCEAMAGAVRQMIRDPLQHLVHSFEMINPKGDRKRPLGYCGEVGGASTAKYCFSRGRLGVSAQKRGSQTSAGHRVRAR